MRRTLAILAAVSTPALVGCLSLGEPEPAEPQPTATAAETAAATPEPSEPQPTATVTETVTATPEPDEGEEDAASEDLDEDLEEEIEDDFTTDRGNIPMPGGQSFSDASTNEDVLEWEAGGVQTQFQCTSDRASAPENGQFIAVEFTVDVLTAYSDVNSNGYQANRNWFDALDEDGRMSNADLASSASYACLNDSEKLPRRILPGSSAQGLIVLDVDIDSGFLIFQDNAGAGESYEWEF